MAATGHMRMAAATLPTVAIAMGVLPMIADPHGDLITGYLPDHQLSPVIIILMREGGQMDAMGTGRDRTIWTESVPTRGTDPQLEQMWIPTYQAMVQRVAEAQEMIALGTTVGDEMIGIGIGWIMTSVAEAPELAVVVEARPETAIGRECVTETL